MFSTLSVIVDNITKFLSSFSTLIGMDMLFVIALVAEAVFVIFFLVKSAFSYEATLNRALDKLNYWLFEKKVVNENNIKELNTLFKTKGPKRLCYYWQQYILFREGTPSSYLSTENLIEKPLKTSSYNSNIKNLTIFTTVWALIVALFSLSIDFTYLTSEVVGPALLLPILVSLIGVVFIVYMRARKNSILNSLYQNVSLFGRFMDNACIDLPSYIDYQILFTPQEIEKGQPVLREFLDYKARKEKEEFNKAKEQEIEYESYDFSSTGVDGSIVLDRAMKESELFLKKKEKILVKISQIESELDSRKKNFDNIQKDYQTKAQASKENVNRLRQMQEETTNRIESNYYRKQQTQEIAKQEQLEAEFEQQRAKYLLEKNEGEEEIKKLNQELEDFKNDVQNAMLGEYQTFFDKFCHSAEKVVSKVFEDKINALKTENDQDKQYITELEIKLKNVPQGQYDAGGDQDSSSTATSEEGKYDENGNYVYPNGTYYDKDGHFHDKDGNVYSQDGKLIESAKEVPKKEDETKEDEKKVVDFDSFDTFDFMTDVSQKKDIYDVAENIVKNVDKDGDIEIINNADKEDQTKTENNEASEEKSDVAMENFTLDESTSTQEETSPTGVEEKPKKKAGRPRKVVQETSAPKRGRGRPKKTAEPVVEKKKPGRPRKILTQTTTAPKKKVGRPKKIVKEVESAPEIKRGRGRPRKQINSILEINKRLSEEEEKLQNMRKSLNAELEEAMHEMNAQNVDDKQAKREELLKEIDSLQAEAQEVINKNQPESKITEINAKLETLLEEIKKLNS